MPSGTSCALDPDGVGVHVISNVADQHQTAPGQRQFAAGGLLVRAIRVEPPVHHPSRLIEARGQRPLRQLQPVPVDLDFIVGVDGRDTVFQIHDGRDCSFQDHVGNPGGIVAGDRARAIDPDLQVQAVVAQKNRGRRAWLTQKTDELLRARQGGSRAAKLDDKLPVFDHVSGRMLAAALQQRTNVSRISRARAITRTPRTLL